MSESVPLTTAALVSAEVDISSRLETLPPVIKSITLTSVGDLHKPTLVNGLLTCTIDTLELVQKPEQSDFEFFELLEKKVFKDREVLKMEFLQSSNGWYQRIPIGYKFPSVKLFALNGPAHPDHPKDHAIHLFQGLEAEEVTSTVGNHQILSWEPFRKARSLNLDFFCARQKGIQALKKCNPNHWNIQAFDSTEEGMLWAYSRMASGEMKSGSIYQESNDSAFCDFFLKSILDKYKDIVVVKEDGQPAKYVLTLENGDQLIASAKEKRTITEFLQNNPQLGRRESGIVNYLLELFGIRIERNLVFNEGHLLTIEIVEKKADL